MDEIDRAAEGQESSPRSTFDSTNRPNPQPVEDTESFDEVDRPSTVMPNTPRSEPDLGISTEEDKQDESENEFGLNVDVTKKLSQGSDFEIIDTPDKSDNEIVFTESSDGPPSSKTDGPFNQFFQRQSPLVKRRTEKTDREGIISTHTTYLPKEPPSSKSNGKIKHEINSEFYYNMNTFPRGKLTLINVKYFQKASGMGDYPRHGTDKDAEGLCALFLELGFIVERHDNPTKKEILNILKAAANEDYTNYSCCACAMLSHGEEGIIYGTDGYVKIKDVTKLFRSRSLAGKPKFFLFQACQGSEYMDPLDSVDGPGHRKSDDDMALTLPSEADFIYAYSTVPGFYSWRNSKRGSWFMESLVSVFRESAHKMDVLRMLTRVNAHVAHRKSRTDDTHTDDKRQIASIITQMRKEFFLFPPYGPLSNHAS